MPIGFSPDETCEVTLDCIDKDAPNRAKFRFRFLSDRQCREVEKLWNAARECKGDVEASALLDKAILIGLAGWSGVTADGKTLEFSADALGEFTLRQKFLMVREYPAATSVAEYDRKNFASPPQSSTAACVETASVKGSA